MPNRKSIKSRYTTSQGNQRSSNSLKRGKNLELIPTDLIMEIFSRLPSKSIARFRSVSKLWSSMLHSPYFTKLFMTRSLACPRLLFAVEYRDEWLFYSSAQPQNLYEKKSLVVAPDYHTKFRGQTNQDEMCTYASGLFYFHNFILTPKEDKVPMICNPITGQYVTLPNPSNDSDSTSYLGFDPIDKQFKVLAEGYPNHHKILKLGTGKVRWRKNFQCPRYNRPCDGICINGVLYYLALKDGGDDDDDDDDNDDDDADDDDVIVCFDVKSEKFKFIESEYIEFFGQLINYNGKLCGIELVNGDADDSIELRMWVLEDIEKQKWSKYIYTLRENKIDDFNSLYVVGVTITGEIVLAMSYSYIYKPFYVFYFNPERNTLIKVEIQGFGANLKTGAQVYTFVDYVEDLSFIDAKQLKYLCSNIKNKKNKKKKKNKKNKNKKKKKEEEGKIHNIRKR
ncbi:F-box protein [Cardamine amara subsp. amara]|uniref:F-box protein n=1 Tax=Cardamine amara subsp. amara TaxID=228776 RepID=A0ABD1BYF8_CARAN